MLFRSGTYWSMHPDLYNRLSEDDQGETRRRIDLEAAKARVLSILMERARKGETGLQNKDIRKITRYDRSQVTRLLRELRNDHPQLKSLGRGAGASYEWHDE